MKKGVKMMPVVFLLVLGGCKQQADQPEPGTYGFDVAFFKKVNVDFVELKSEDGKSKVMVIPAYQGRVMTSTADGDKGNSFGWINYKLIESGKVDPQFNPVGGEERFWLGPEGGNFSFYFEKGKEQVYENWKVPSVLDTETFDIVSRNEKSVVFTKNTILKNVAQTEFKIGIKRTISLLGRDKVAQLLKVAISPALNFLAYQSENVITNLGDKAWTKENGLPSIWLLGMFNPTPTTTVFIPYQKEAGGKIANDEYFGKVPADRLMAVDGILYFKIDGKYRSKIGIPANRAKDLCGSYDSAKKVLTILWYSLPKAEKSYVNGQWGKQENPFDGDVINSYNDGPIADGSIMGPFYEIETSSPGAELAPDESMTHTQCVMHIQGDEKGLDAIVNGLFGVSLHYIATRFNK